MGFLLFSSLFAVLPFFFFFLFFFSHTSPNAKFFRRCGRKILKSEPYIVSFVCRRQVQRCGRLVNLSRLRGWLLLSNESQKLFAVQRWKVFCPWQSGTEREIGCRKGDIFSISSFVGFVLILLRRALLFWSNRSRCLPLGKVSITYWAIGVSPVFCRSIYYIIYIYICIYLTSTPIP